MPTTSVGMAPGLDEIGEAVAEMYDIKSADAIPANRKLRRLARNVEEQIHLLQNQMK